MNAVSDIVFRPLAPMELVYLLAALGLAAVALAFWRGLPGAWARLGALAALLAALLDPALLNEEREPLADIVLLAVDESESQSLENRTAVSEAAATAVIERLQARAAADRALVEVRRVAIAGDAARGTRLNAALAEAAAQVAPERLSGAVVITDGAVADADRPIVAFEGAVEAPVHVLVTGREDEFDRRLEVETAPGFGIVGESVSISFRVEETGAPSAFGAQARVDALIDGVQAASGFVAPGRSTTFTLPLDHPGATVVELKLETAEGELTERNNVAAFTVNAVRDRLRVLLVSGEPYAGERIWRNLLKADPSVDLVHFTILRPPHKAQHASSSELALIPFPTTELFEDKIDEFDLIVFDRYRRAGILYNEYIQNIVDYVREGGAVLVATGPAFAGYESIYRSPLADLLPASPTEDVIEKAFRPTVTEIGARHPVTRGLEEGGASGPDWGRWFRLVEVAALSGDTVMSGADKRPLLILDRAEKGRVALLASDNAWLWARGYDGGGPHAELLRRLAHWLMKEPELEEEALVARTTPGGFRIERRSLTAGDKAVTIEAPDGAASHHALEAAGAGLWVVDIETETLGLHRIADADESVIAADGEPREPLSAIAVVGPPAPKEFSNPVSTTELMQLLAEQSGGSIRRLGDQSSAVADDGGAPELRRTRPGRATSGDGWIGLPRRDAYEVRGVTLAGLAPSWAFFLIAAAFMVLAWRREGR